MITDDLRPLNEAAARILKGAKAYKDYGSQESDIQRLADKWLVLFDPSTDEDLRNSIRSLLQLAKMFRKQCADGGHSVTIFGDSAKCTVCDDYLGWWCPKSPDHVCHIGYHGQHEIKLLDGRVVEMNQDDSLIGLCVFCEEPDERQ